MSSENIHIRTALLKDADAIIHVWQETGLTRLWNPPYQDIEHCLKNQTSTLFIAETDNQIIGTAMVGYDGHRGWLYYLAVLPEFQKQGIAKILYRHVEAWLKERDAPKLQILIRSENKAVMQFYKSLGFTESQSVLMGKPLI